jgi:hypothetical protein
MLEHWPQGLVANWPPKFDGILFFLSLGANTRPSSSAFISNYGQIEKFFSISALTPSIKPWGLISTFVTNRNAGFGLNIGPDS